MNKLLPIILLLVLSIVNCASKIGDNCDTNIDCGTNRLCDTSQPGGYCTISDCLRNQCPAEAVCIFFETEESYCMARCESDRDCRTNYFCNQTDGDAPYCTQIP